ncbi:MAG: MbnP family protein [Bacteroidota bacterium]|nr:MbnP family protein [Bacteroidota bacterium]
MKSISSKIILLAVFLGVLISSCNKKHDDPQPVQIPVETAKPQNVTFKFKPVKGDSSINFYSTFRTGAGVRFNLSMYRYYLSNIKLVKNDGSEYSIADKYLLVTPNIEEYSLGEVPAGDYKGIKFSVGIDSATNHKDPTFYPNTSPLSIQSPAIHWSWNSGYIFMMIEGTCDTTSTGNDVLTYGRFSKDMFFHIGLDKHYRQVSLNKSFNISSSPQTITIMADIDKFWTNVDLKTENQTHSFSNTELAKKVADNFPNMFTVQ